MISLTELQRDAFTELLNIGMGRAAAALSEMVSEEVMLSVPFVDFMSRHDASALIQEKGSERIMAVSQAFSGLFWGDTMLVFPETKSLELVRSFIQESFPLEDMTEMEQEAFMEIGNIILNSCIGSIANMLHQEVSSSLPSLWRGACTDILGGQHASDTDDVVMFLRMDFSLQERSIDGYVMFIIDGNAIAALQASIDEFLSHV